MNDGTKKAAPAKRKGSSTPQKGGGGATLGAADLGLLLLRLGLATLILERAWEEATAGEATWTAIGDSIDFIGFHPGSHLELGAASVFLRLGAATLLGVGLTTRVAAALLLLVAALDVVVGLRTGGGIPAAEAPILLSLSLFTLLFTGGGGLSFDRKTLGTP